MSVLGGDPPRFPIPDGFQTLLTSLAREVLRAQPTDIYRFSALYFETLIGLQKEHGADLLNHPPLYKQFKNTLLTEASNRSLIGEGAFIKREQIADQKQYERPTELSDDHQDYAEPVGSPEYDERAATKIQAVYRGHVTRKHLQEDRASGESTSPQPPASLPVDASSQQYHDLPSPEDLAAAKIQAGVRGYLTRTHVAKMKEEETKAAQHIQANYRGYITRKHLHEEGMATGSHGGSTPSDGGQLPELDDCETTAATKIQAAYRGFETRKNLAEQGIPVHTPHEHGHDNREQTDTHYDDLDDSETVAATKIQAAYRGHHAREELKKSHGHDDGDSAETPS